MKKNNLLVDVTTLLKWNRSPVGIIRTQLEFVDYLIKQNDGSLYCKFNDNKDQLELVDIETLRKVVLNLKNYKNKIIKESKNKVLYTQDNLFLKAFDFYKRHGVKQLLIHICKLKCPNKVKDLVKKIYIKFFKINNIDMNNESKDRNNFGKILFAPEIFQASQLDYDFLTENTIFVSLGLDWDYSNYPLLYWLKKKYKFQFIGSFYDGIPVENPELVQSYYFSQKFFSHLYYLIHLSDKIFCISDFSRNQLINICKKHYIEEIPYLRTIHLGDSVYEEKKIQKYTKRNHKENYVLYVSTIESRKNHILLLRIWQKLLKENFKELPDLVLVGMMGWGIDEFLEIYQSDKELQKVVHIYHDVDDEELVSIYTDSNFTVFPSFVEGWGLGAVESMLYGKPCLISDCDALKEATQGLMPALDPNNVTAWCEEIKKFTTEKDILKYYKKIIDEKFKSRKWEEFSSDFLKFSKDEK